MRAWSRILAWASAATLIAACSNDSSTPLGLGTTSAKSGATSNGGGTDSSHTPTPTTPTSSGPVASVVLTPHALTLAVGNYASVAALALDANGVAMAGKRATWRFSDPSIVVGDTGLVYGKAVGTAKVYGTIDGKVDSATVTVVAGSPTSNPTTPPSQPGVSQFDLTLTVVAGVPGTDTTKVAPVAGALVKLYRTGGVNGDSLSTRVAAGAATSDANGVVSVKGLAGGSYQIDIDSPVGSGLAPSSAGFAAPRSSDFRVTVRMFKN